MEMRKVITQKIAQTLASFGIDVDARDIKLEFPGELSHGDYATGVALQFAKQTGKAPRILAEEIVAQLGFIGGVAKIEIAGPGFINFTLAPSVFAESIGGAETLDMWGSNVVREGQTVMVEYTDPNPFKEFHIGHLMSNAIGESIARLLEFSGAKVIRANYQGDVGLHVAKAIWGYRNLTEDTSSVSNIARWGMAYRFGSEQYENNENAKKEIDALGLEIFEKTFSIKEYAEGRALSLEHFEELYSLLGTKFDLYFFESETGPLGVQLVRAHPEIFERSEDAVIFKAEQYGLHTRVFLNRLGLPTYEAKDLGLLQLKPQKASVDASISITASEQSEYFKVVLEAAKHIPEVEDFGKKTKHISHGMMRFADGKMSSRTGNVITGESLLADLIQEAHVRAAESRADDVEVLAKQVAVAAIKYQILRQSSGKDIVFDRERALSLEGDSGPYIQYAYARTCAILARAREANVAPLVDANAEPSDLTRLMYRFPEIVEHAASELEPHIVAQYLLHIASAFNSWYAQEQILDGTSGAAHKVAIVEALSKMLKNGLWILGIPTPEKM